MSDKKATIVINATDKTKGALTSVQKNVKKTSKEADTLAMRFRNVARATVVMEGPLGGIAGRFSAMATMIGSVSLGMIAAGLSVAALTATMASSLKKFAQWEVQTLKVDQLLKQTGGSAGVTGGEIEQMSLRIGRATLLSANDVRDSAAMLLSFKSIGVDSFESVLKVGADMQALAGGGLKDAVKQLGKALEDPATGLSALRRAGVSFTVAQRDMIVAMNDGGNAAGAQAEILKILEGQLGGASAAQGGGLAGAADLVGENWSNMLISISKDGAGKAATGWLNEMANVLAWINHLISPDKYIALAEARQKLNEATAAYNDTQKEGRVYWESAIKDKKYAMDLAQVQVGIAQAEIDREQELIKTAREKGRVAREEADKLKVIEDAELDRRKSKAGADKQLGKDKAAAGKYGETLAKENEAFSRSLMNKSDQESAYLADRIVKINDNVLAGALTEEDGRAQALMALEGHKLRIGEINDAANQDEVDANNKKERDKQRGAANITRAGASLMNAQSERVFKVGKAFALANAVIKGYEAVQGAYAAGSLYNPAVAVAYAAVAAAATAVQVQNISAQKFTAREFGGSVIGGRSYLVGERGPELFTAPRTGQIINNSTTSTVGGSSSINVTVLNEPDSKYIERNQTQIWEGILGMMNENGLSFS